MSGYVNRSSGRGRSFAQAIDICLQNYVGFAGRAPRSEYWYWALFCILLGLVVGFVSGFLAVIVHEKALYGIALAVLNLAILLPSISVIVRRLHDVGRSGWWYFIGLVPLVGPILLLVWFCTRGTTGQNRFGPDPLADF